MFSPHGISSLFLQVPLKVLRFENLDSRNAMFFFTNCKFTKNGVTTIMPLFENSNNCLGVRISPEKGLCKLTQPANLFKVLPTPSQSGKPETYVGIVLSRRTEFFSQLTL